MVRWREGRRQSAANPFLPTAPAADAHPDEETTAPRGEQPAQGLSRPIGIEVDEADTARLSLIPQLRRPRLWVVSLHGGSGASTVTALLGEDVAEAGRCWPTPAGDEPASPVLLVARAHARGQDEAEAAARTWASGHLGTLPLLGLVLVDDAPKLTPTQRRASARLGAMVPHTWRLPWQPPWREELTPDPVIAPVRVRRLVTDICSRADQAREEPTPGRKPA